MANYKYNVELEVFKRTDNRGNYLAVNISEAQRIVTLLNLGYSISKIENKVKLTNPKAGTSTIKSFIKNYKEGNIEIPEDAPAPVQDIEELTLDDKTSNIEERMSKLEEDWIKFQKEHIGVIPRVKRWFGR